MKKVIFLAVAVVFSFLFVTDNPVHAVTEESGTSEVTIYDKNGAQVLPVENFDPLTPIIQPMSATPPTKIKWLDGSASYLSDPFSASGRRYGGYVFMSSNSSGKFKLTFSLGGFGVDTLLNPGDPGSVMERFNLPLSGSPYTLITHRGFYFLVDHPNYGQTYRVTAKP